MITSKPVYSGASPCGPEPQPGDRRHSGAPEARQTACKRSADVWHGDHRQICQGLHALRTAWRHIQLAIHHIKLGDCRTASRRVTLTEDLLKVAKQQCVDSVTHAIFSFCWIYFLCWPRFASCSRRAVSEALVAVSFHAARSAARLKRKTRRLFVITRWRTLLFASFSSSGFSSSGAPGFVVRSYAQVVQTARVFQRNRFALV